MTDLPRLLPCAALVCILAACGGGEVPPPAPRLVFSHIVGQGDGRAEANYSGEVKPRHEIAVSFRVGGKLRERLVEVGQSVGPGQPLARLDPADVELGASSARASLAAAESEFAYAKAELARYQDLRARNFVSQAALEAKEAAYHATRGRMEAAGAQAGLARNQAAYATLSADGAGVVSAVLAEAGQVVAAGQPVLRIARPGEMEVAIAVPENRVDELRAADRLDISLWAAGGRSYAGRIREISPMADPVTRTYAVRVSLLDPDAGVRLGMTANVLIKRQAAAAALLIPATALFQQGDQPAVWIIGADQALTLRPVEVAAFREDGVLVAGGLQAGERIVAAGVHKVVAGEKVRLAP
jgi:multidrug efflux system membrane fusion protein